ncbi:MAG: hypothetical protein WCV99_11585 [Sterolibacterium sp.]|jgi:hypothetical protein
MNIAANTASSDGKRRMRQRWELIRVLYFQARIGWMAVGLLLALFALMMVEATRFASDPARSAGLTFMLIYFGAIVSVMSGALLGVGASHPALLSLWRRLPRALPLARSSVLLAGCGLWGVAALGGAILALLAGSLAPLSGALGSASAGLGIGFLLVQNSRHRIAWSLRWLIIAAITGFAILSGSGVAKPNWVHLWAALQYLLIPVWPAVWFAYQRDLDAPVATPKRGFKLLQFVERMIPDRSLPRDRADLRLLMSAPHRINMALGQAPIVGLSLLYGWISRDIPFLFLTAVLVMSTPSTHQSSVGARWLSPRSLSLPGGLDRARMAKLLFRLDWRGRIPTGAMYCLIWLAGLLLFRQLTAAQVLILLATAASAAVLSAAWTIAILPLARSSITLYSIFSFLPMILAVSSIALIAWAAGWHEQLNGLAATLWAVAEFTLAYILALGLVRISRGGWARYDLQHLTKFSAEIRRLPQNMFSYLQQERS